jgi:hypothetical protein
MCVTDLDPDLAITENEQAPGVAWGRAGQAGQAGQAGKYAGVAWGQLGRQDDHAHDEDTEEETEQESARSAR